MLGLLLFSFFISCNIPIIIRIQIVTMQSVVICCRLSYCITYCCNSLQIVVILQVFVICRRLSQSATGCRNVSHIIVIGLNLTSWLEKQTMRYCTFVSLSQPIKNAFNYETLCNRITGRLVIYDVIVNPLHFIGLPAKQMLEYYTIARSSKLSK